MLTPMFRIALLVASLTTVAACSSPEEKAAEFLENAQTFLDNNEYGKAQIEFKNALQLNQNLPDAWYGLAKTHEINREWQQAYGSLNTLREMAPGHVDGRIMLGQMLLASNQIDQALQDAKEILDMAPQDSRAHSLMAAVNYRLDNLDQAREGVQKALSIVPDYNEAMLVNARVLISEK